MGVAITAKVVLGSVMATATAATALLTFLLLLFELTLADPHGEN